MVITIEAVQLHNSLILVNRVDNSLMFKINYRIRNHRFLLNIGFRLFYVFPFYVFITRCEQY